MVEQAVMLCIKARCLETQMEKKPSKIFFVLGKELETIGFDY